MGEIKAIETEYKGCLFRSRLEARWATFFDFCNVEWQYEKEGFDLGDGIYYLPDFYLPHFFADGSDLWVEVKGVMTPEDEEKIIRFSGNNQIYVVGDIPQCENNDFGTLIDNMARLSYSGKVPPYNFQYIDGDYFGAFFCIDKKGIDEHHLVLLGDDSNYLCEADEKETLEAYSVARQARFEHGQHGGRAHDGRIYYGDDIYTKKVKIGESQVDVYCKDFCAACELEVSAWTSGYHGGNAGCTTYFSITNFDNIQVNDLHLIKNKHGFVEGFSMELEGDNELWALQGALEFASKVLNDLNKNKGRN